MKIKELEAFVLVVEEKGIVNASEKLFCVPSNISKLINSLDEKSKQPLFHREGRELNLTPYGRHFYEQVKVFLEYKDNFEQALLDTESAKLLIGGIDIALDYLLPKYIYQYKIENKNINFEFYRDYSSNLEYKIDNKQYDVVFSDGPLTSTKLNSQLVFPEKLVLVRKNIEINEKPIIYSYGTQCSYRAYIKAWANKNFKNFRIVEVESYPLILSLVQNNMGISLIPNSIMGSYPHLHDLIDYSNYVECNIYIIWNKFNESKQMIKFIKYFLDNRNPA